MNQPSLHTGRPRRSALLPLLIVVLVALPILEVWLLIQVGRQIGALPTLAILIVEAIFGAWLMRREGDRAWRELNDAFAHGRVPAGELADAALVLVGGVLLMLPGFATDLIGLLFLLPFTRPWARRLLGYVAARRVSRLGMTVPPISYQQRVTQHPMNTGHPMNINDVIEGEVVDDGSDDRPPR